MEGLHRERSIVYGLQHIESIQWVYIQASDSIHLLPEHLLEKCEVGGGSSASSL